MGSGHTNEIYHVLEDHRGVTWFTTGAGLARRVNGSIEKLDPYARSPHGPTYRIYEDSQGNLWVNKRSGLFRVTATGLEPLVTEWTLSVCTRIWTAIYG
jgi:ligand-binding sensor domain-containing protein